MPTNSKGREDEFPSDNLITFLVLDTARYLVTAIFPLGHLGRRLQPVDLNFISHIVAMILDLSPCP